MKSLVSLNKLFIIFLVILFLSISVKSLDIDDVKPFIGEDDEYVKKSEIGSSESFRWTVYRNSSKTYVVSINSDGFEKWDQEISSNFFVLDDLESYKIVYLNCLYLERERLWIIKSYL